MGGGDVKDDEADGAPVLITEAKPSYDEEYSARRKKYAIMMLMRLPLLIGAGFAYQFSVWLALALVVASIPLPWMAVLIANERPVRKAESVSRYRPRPGRQSSLEAREHQVVDSTQ
jgi:hypothetical protein